VGVPGPQGIDNGPRAHPGRGYEPAGGANILSSCSLSESLYVGILKRWRSMADTWRPMIRADIAMLAEPSRVAVPRGPLLLSGNCGARGNHGHVPRTDGTPRTWDTWGFRFSAATPPSHRPVPTDKRVLGPPVGAWVCGVHGGGMKHRARWAVAYREYKQGMEPSVWIYTPILLPFASISFVLCTSFPSYPSATVHRHGH
jgi:hypothetical protein